MRQGLVTIIASLFAALLVAGAARAETVSLRDDAALSGEEKAIDNKRVLTQEGGFKRAWKLQPPSISHTIDKERINLQENTCLRCHSPEAYQKEKAKKIGDSHFIDRDGNVQKEVNGRRYFCTQCHTTQVDAQPLVENTFAGQ
jgi:cytochrome c-type protein NapB